MPSTTRSRTAEFTRKFRSWTDSLRKSPDAPLNASSPDKLRFCGSQFRLGQHPRTTRSSSSPGSRAECRRGYERSLRTTALRGCTSGTGGTSPVAVHARHPVSTCLGLQAGPTRIVPQPTLGRFVHVLGAPQAPERLAEGGRIMTCTDRLGPVEYLVWEAHVVVYY